MSDGFDDARERVAGRALDAEVAEKVMGAKWWRSTVTGRRALFLFTARKPEWFPDPADGSEFFAMDWDLFPRYSTNIADAWLVVDGVCMGLGRDLGMRVSGSPHDGWWAEVYDTSPGGYVMRDGTEIPETHVDEIHAATAPLAICLAALAAVAQIGAVAPVPT